MNTDQNTSTEHSSTRARNTSSKTAKHTVICPRCEREFIPKVSPRTGRPATICFPCRNGHQRCAHALCQRRAVYGDFCPAHAPVDGANWLSVTAQRQDARSRWVTLPTSTVDALVKQYGGVIVNSDGDGRGDIVFPTEAVQAAFYAAALSAEQAQRANEKALSL